MEQDIENLMNAPPDAFEVRLFLLERELHLVEEAFAHTARATRLLDAAFDNFLDDLSEEDTRRVVYRMRGLRINDVDEQLTRAFAHLHDMHRLHRETMRSELKCPTACSSAQT